MKVRKRLIILLILLAALPLMIFGYMSFTFPWEVSWVKSATALTLENPSETVTGERLDSFLCGLDSNNDWGLCCTFNERKGSIRIRNEKYPVDYRFDKFQGYVLIVHGPWKNVWVSRRAEVINGQLKDEP